MGNIYDFYMMVLRIMTYLRRMDKTSVGVPGRKTIFLA